MKSVGPVMTDVSQDGSSFQARRHENGMYKRLKKGPQSRYMEIQLNLWMMDNLQLKFQVF